MGEGCFVVSLGELERESERCGKGCQSCWSDKQYYFLSILGMRCPMRAVGTAYSMARARSVSAWVINKSHGDLTFRDTYIKRHHHHVQESASN
jgi:hypothetical protein